MSTTTQNKHGEWKVRAEDPDRYGQPSLGLEYCSYCGSITPEEFVRLCGDERVDIEVADWKYGWPHKVYLRVPNPNADEVRAVGSESGPEIDGTHADDRWSCFAHGRGKECGCPRERGVTGNWSRMQWGTYETVTVKFYTEHLMGFEGLETSAALIKKRTGIGFEVEEDGRLHWRGVPVR